MKGLLHIASFKPEFPGLLSPKEHITTKSTVASPVYMMGPRTTKAQKKIVSSKLAVNQNDLGHPLA